MQITGPTGTVFTLLRKEPYTRKDGTYTELAVWHGPCADCGSPFTVKTPGGVTSACSRAFARMRCDLHKATWPELSKRMAAAKRKLSDEDVAEIRKLAKEGTRLDTLSLIFPATTGTIREIVAGRRR